MDIFIFIAVIVIVLVAVNIISNRGISQVNVAAAKTMIDDSGTTIIDVRTPEEYRSGHLKNAMLMPVSEIAGRIGEIDSLKDRPILVYCHAGNRSASASQVLRRNGFTRISNLRGGITAWNGAGFKTVKGN